MPRAPSPRHLRNFATDDYAVALLFYFNGKL